MDLSIAVEGWRENVKYGMRREPIWKKLCVCGGGLMTMIMTLILGSYQMSYWSNVLVIQNNFNNTAKFNNTLWENSTYYDIQFINGSYSDEEKAKALKISINETCIDDCQKHGTQWSIIYLLAGFTLIFMAINALLLVAGGWIYRSRMIGIFCHHFLTIFLLASVVVTYRYRYREQGQLAALSLMPSQTTSTTAYDPNRTYADDAEFIEKFFIGELIALILCLITSNLGCCKFGNKTNIRDSQVTSSMANSHGVAAIERADQQELLNDN